MKDKKVEQIAEMIKELISGGKTKTPAEERRRMDTISLLKDVLAVEYGRRKGWLYVNRFCRGYYNFPPGLLNAEEIPSKNNCIMNGTNFNIKALREHKKYAYCRGIDGMAPGGEFMDHPYFYKDKLFRAAAIVSHPYGLADGLEEWALSRGLKAVIADFPSWWYPGSTVAIEFTSNIERVSK